MSDPFYAGNNWGAPPLNHQDTGVPISFGVHSDFHSHRDNNPPLVPSQSGEGGFGSMNNFTNFDTLAPVAASAALNFGSQQFQVVEGSVNEAFGFMRHYFDVNTTYVAKKLMILIFPFVNKRWKRLGDSDDHLGGIGSSSSIPILQKFASPRSDHNSPDLYIPLMALVTYAILVGYCIGHSNLFSPEVLGETVSRGLAIHGFGVLILWIGSYLTSNFSISLLDLIAYAGYIFPGIIINILGFLLFGQISYWPILIYTTLAYSFFLIKSMAQIVNLRVDKSFLYFLVGYCAFQFFISWFLGRSAIYYFPSSGSSVLDSIVAQNNLLDGNLDNEILDQNEIADDFQ